MEQNKKVEIVLEDLQICRTGMCSLCKYHDNCMDGLIDDCYELLMEIKNNG